MTVADRGLHDGDGAAAHRLFQRHRAAVAARDATADRCQRGHRALLVDRAARRHGGLRRASCVHAKRGRTALVGRAGLAHTGLQPHHPANRFFVQFAQTLGTLCDNGLTIVARAGAAGGNLGQCLGEGPHARRAPGCDGWRGALRGVARATALSRSLPRHARGRRADGPARRDDASHRRGLRTRTQQTGHDRLHPHSRRWS